MASSADIDLVAAAWSPVAAQLLACTFDAPPASSLSPLPTSSGADVAVPPVSPHLLFAADPSPLAQLGGPATGLAGLPDWVALCGGAAGVTVVPGTHFSFHSAETDGARAVSRWLVAAMRRWEKPSSDGCKCTAP